MSEQELLAMELHQVIKIDRLKSVMRVPGGWLYHMTTLINKKDNYGGDVPVDISTSSVFVPEPTPRIITYEGYEEWLKSQEEQYPEPEPNQSEEDENRLLTLGHY